jgi:hypothetical protein
MNAADEKLMGYWKKKRPHGKIMYSLKAALWLSLPISFGSELFRILTEYDPALQSFNFINAFQLFVVSFAMSFWFWGFQWNAQEKKYQQLNNQK